jgi:type I restriction enzyme S subunit
MGELGVFFGGLSGKSKSDFTDGNSRYVSFINVLRNIAVDLRRDDFVKVTDGERQNMVQLGDVLFTGASEAPEEVALSSVVTSNPTEPTYMNSFTIGFRPNPDHGLEPHYAKHLFRSASMRRDLVRTANGVTRFNVSRGSLAQVQVPLPSRHTQLHVADTLDKFDALVNDLTIGLPAELAARRKQYEYYRDKLLTFKELAA